MDGLVDGWIVGRVDELKDGWLVRWIDGGMDWGMGGLLEE